MEDFLCHREATRRGRERKRERQREGERGKDVKHLLLVNMLSACTVSYSLDMTSNGWYAAHCP